MSSFISNAQATTLTKVAVGLNGFSFFLCILQITFYLILRIKRPHLVNRIWIRLIAGVSVGNAFYHIAQMASAILSEDGPFCSMSVVFYVFFTHLTVFLTAGIAVNLHLIMRNRATSSKPTIEVEVWYYVVPVLGSIVFSLPGWWFEAYGYDKVNIQCWFVDPFSIKSLMWQWFSLYGPIFIVVLYCFGVIFGVVYQLLQRERQLSREIAHSEMRQKEAGIKKKERKVLQKETEEKRKRRQRERTIIFLTLRVARYPAIPVITQTLNVVYATVNTTTQKAPYNLLFAAYTFTSLQGLLYFLLFCLDPAIQQAWYDLRGVIRTMGDMVGTSAPVMDAKQLESQDQNATMLNDDDDDPNAIAAGSSSTYSDVHQNKLAYAGLSITPSGTIIGEVKHVENQEPLTDIVLDRPHPRDKDAGPSDSQLDCMMLSL